MDGQEIDHGIRKAMDVNGKETTMLCACGDTHGFACGGIVRKETLEKVLRLQVWPHAGLPFPSLLPDMDIDFGRNRAVMEKESHALMEELKAIRAEALRASRRTPYFHRPNTNRNTRRRMILAEKRREEIRREGSIFREGEAATRADHTGFLRVSCALWRTRFPARI